MPVAALAPVKAASRRMAAYRRRQRRGEIACSITVSPAIVDALVRMQRLRTGEVEDRRQIATAIAALLDELARDFDHRNFV